MNKKGYFFFATIFTLLGLFLIVHGLGFLPNLEVPFLDTMEGFDNVGIILGLVLLATGIGFWVGDRAERRMRRLGMLARR